MSEWITTGQMIDSLKVGEVAEWVRKEKSHFNKIKKFPSGDICFINNDGNFISTVILEGLVNDGKWRILPDYVSFSEAMEAAKQGKNLAYEDVDGSEFLIDAEEAVNFNLEALSVSGESLHDLFTGKWKLRND